MEIQTLFFDQLVGGDHERCAWCTAPFVFTNGAWQRFKGLDGKYYCNGNHGSAPYLTQRTRYQ
jgi:hypothetical protein